MAYLSIYRKYRPNDFDSVIGQDHIVRILRNQVKTDTVSHAYLFTGTRGTGKTSVAKIFARAINCTNNANGSACGECEVCRELNNVNNLDIIEMDAASNNGVDDIRDIREAVKYAPTVGKYKVYIIDEAHMLTQGAFNALLKTLEEPPAHAVFILATTEAHKIPDTILSRCMRFDFRLVSATQIAERIKFIYDDMRVTYEDSAIVAIAEAGDGSVRDALSIADMCVSYSDGRVTYNDTLEVLGVSSPAKIVDIIQAILANDVSSAFAIIDELASLGKSIPSLAKDITKMLRNLYVTRTCDITANLVIAPRDIQIRLIKMPNFENTRVINIIDMFSSLEMSMRYSRLPRIVLENAIAKACEITASIDINGLLTRVRALEAGGVVAPKQGTNTDIPKVEYAKKTQFDVGAILGRINDGLKKDSKLLLQFTLDKIENKDVALVDGTIIINVPTADVKDEFLRERCDKLFLQYIAEEFDVEKIGITSLAFVVVDNGDDIQQAVGYVKNIIGEKLVTVIK